MFQSVVKGCCDHSNEHSRFALTKYFLKQWIKCKLVKKHYTACVSPESCLTAGCQTVFLSKSTNSEFLPKRTTPIPSQDFPARVSQPAFNSTSYTLSSYETTFTSAISTEAIFKKLTVFHLLKESASFYKTAKHVPTDLRSVRHLTPWQLIQSNPSTSIFLRSLLMLSYYQG